MGIWVRRGGFRGSLDLLDRDDPDDSRGAGSSFRRLGGGADGSCRANRGLGEALSQAAPWPAATVGIARAFRSGDCHGLSRLLGGGARGGGLRGFCPGLKVSMTIMGPPQQGQGWLSASGGVSVSSAGAS